MVLRDGSPYAPYALKATDDATYDRQLTSDAFKWIVKYPVRFIFKVIDNLLSFWYVVETPKKMFITGLFSLGLIALALRSTTIDSHKHMREQVFFLVLIGTIDLLYSPVLGVFRFSLVTHPLLCVLSGPSLSSLAAKLRERIK